MSDLKGISMKCEPPGREAQKIMDRDKRFMATTNKVMPVVAKRGKGMYVEDVDGNVYLDFQSGIAVIVETFYTITRYEKPFDPDYSEMDFVYLPNGGWGGPTSINFTTWETVQIEPWNADNASNSVNENLAGWHTLIAQVTGGTVRYFVDGKMLAQHGGDYYPDAPMSINFNLWFIDGGLNGASDVREYQEDIDWVFHEADVLLMPDEVDVKISELRNASVKFQDTVSPGAIPLASPCDL